jgi:hypothetical protein
MIPRRMMVLCSAATEIAAVSLNTLKRVILLYERAYGHMQIDSDSPPGTLWVLGFVTSSRALERDGGPPAA